MKQTLKDLVITFGFIAVGTGIVLTSAWLTFQIFNIVF